MDTLRSPTPTFGVVKGPIESQDTQIDLSNVHRVSTASLPDLSTSSFSSSYENVEYVEDRSETAEESHTSDCSDDTDQARVVTAVRAKVVNARASPSSCTLVSRCRLISSPVPNRIRHSIMEADESGLNEQNDTFGADDFSFAHFRKTQPANTPGSTLALLQFDRPSHYTDGYYAMSDRGTLTHSAIATTETHSSTSHSEILTHAASIERQYAVTPEVCGPQTEILLAAQPILHVEPCQAEVQRPSDALSTGGWTKEMGEDRLTVNTEDDVDSSLHVPRSRAEVKEKRERSRSARRRAASINLVADWEGEVVRQQLAMPLQNVDEKALATTTIAEEEESKNDIVQAFRRTFNVQSCRYKEEELPMSPRAASREIQSAAATPLSDSRPNVTSPEVSYSSYDMPVYSPKKMSSFKSLSELDVAGSKSYKSSAEEQRFFSRIKSKNKAGKHLSVQEEDMSGNEAERIKWPKLRFGSRGHHIKQQGEAGDPPSEVYENKEGIPDCPSIAFCSTPNSSPCFDDSEREFRFSDDSSAAAQAMHKLPSKQYAKSVSSVGSPSKRFNNTVDSLVLASLAANGGSRSLSKTMARKEFGSLIPTPPPPPPQAQMRKGDRNWRIMSPNGLKGAKADEEDKNKPRGSGDFRRSSSHDSFIDHNHQCGTSWHNKTFAAADRTMGCMNDAGVDESHLVRAGDVDVRRRTNDSGFSREHIQWRTDSADLNRSEDPYLRAMSNPSTPFVQNHKSFSSASLSQASFSNLSLTLPDLTSTSSPSSKAFFGNLSRSSSIAAKGPTTSITVEATLLEWDTAYELAHSGKKNVKGHFRNHGLSNVLSTLSFGKQRRTTSHPFHNAA